MENIIIISKVDGAYLITSPTKPHIRAKIDDAMALVKKLIDEPVDGEDWPNANAWVKDVLDEENKEK